MTHSRFALSVCLAAAMVLTSAAAAPAQEKPAVVCNVKVLSDKVPDVSSLEAWKATTFKPGMTEQERAIAVWNSVVAFTFDTTPPKERPLPSADPLEDLKKDVQLQKALEVLKGLKTAQRSS